MKLEGWESRLTLHIELAADLPFAWGSNDCALWCADWVRVATGDDFASAWRGRYASDDELADLLRAEGMHGAEDIADRHLGKTPIMFARRGDIVLHPRGSLGICSGAFSYFLTEKGVTRLETLRCRRAWEVD